MIERHDYEGFGVFYLYTPTEERELPTEDESWHFRELPVVFLACPDEPAQDHRGGIVSQGHYCPECDIWWACPLGGAGVVCRAPVVIPCESMCFPVKCKV